MLRAIVEAKFHKDPEDADVPGSAILAGVAVRIRDEVMAEEVRREGAVAESRWRDWIRIGPERREWEAARNYAAGMWTDTWHHWSADERRAAAEYLLSPFDPGDAGLLLFLTEVEAALGLRSAPGTSPSQPA